MGTGDEYWKRHREVLEPVGAVMGSLESEVDREALQNSYDEHLSQLGLLQARYAVDMRTKQPEFDPRTGAQKVRGYELTRLGQLLLRQVGVSAEGQS
jgi:hypothetical protein